MIEAVDLCARLEGLLIDPVYTGKAMSGLIGLVRSGRFKPRIRSSSCIPAACRRSSPMRIS